VTNETNQTNQTNEINENPTIVIQPTRGWGSLKLHELWEYRELLWFMVWRDVKGKYRQMAFGPLWIILIPIVNMVIFSLIFGKLAKLPSEGVPYPIFTYVALLPWQFFATATDGSAKSLLSQQNVISKVYFPRLIIPVSYVVAAFIDFLASFAVLIGMMAFYRILPTWRVVTLPFFLLLAAATALGVGLWLAGLAVKFHDVALGLGYALTIWQYVTPVAYSSTLIPARLQTLYRLNPMAAVVDGFRWALLNGKQAPDWTLGVVCVLVALLVISGAFYFKRTERTIVDVI